jgi:response regulator RpfG family c-di-GMP phosphodiesterase
LLKLGASIALTHHEKWDGTGYPHGIPGESIPLEGRLIALADVFDALVSKRCYKSAMPLDQIKTLIANERGRQFDPILADKFLESWDEVNSTAEKMKD